MTKDEALKKAFKQAFQLGQDYWYQADHEYVSQNKKSDVTRAKFEQLMEEALAQAEFDRVHEFLEKDAGIHVSQQAHPEQEPVGWLDSNDKLAEFMHKDLKAEHDKRDSSTPRYFQIPVYTTPPQRTWVGLTDEEISAIDWKSDETLHDFARAIEAKLKDKNS